MRTSWAGGSVRDSCPLADSMVCSRSSSVALANDIVSTRKAQYCFLIQVVQRSFLMSVTLGGCWPRSKWLDDCTGSVKCVCTSIYHYIIMTSPLNIHLQEKLTEFILASQDEETGGFADRPGDMVSWLLWCHDDITTVLYRFRLIHSTLSLAWQASHC